MSFLITHNPHPVRSPSRKATRWDRKRLLNRFEFGTKRRAGRQISAERLRCSSNMSFVRNQDVICPDETTNKPLFLINKIVTPTPTTTVLGEGGSLRSLRWSVGSLRIQGAASRKRLPGSGSPEAAPRKRLPGNGYREAAPGSGAWKRIPGSGYGDPLAESSSQ